MKTRKILSTLAVATAVVALATPLTVNAATEGSSEASVTVKDGTTPPGPSGSLTFLNVSDSARIEFADTTLAGTILTAKEKVLGKAVITISDTRINQTAKTGFTVSVKDVSPDTPNAFYKNNLILALTSSDILNGGTHTHTKVNVNTTADQPVFVGGLETGVTEHQVKLNPTLAIPAALDKAGSYSASLLWTLTPEV